MAFNGTEMKDACRMTALFLQSDELVDMVESYDKKTETENGLVTDKRLDSDPDGILLVESVRTALFDISNDGFVKVSSGIVRSSEKEINMHSLYDSEPKYVLYVTREEDGTPVKFSSSPRGIYVGEDGKFMVTYASRENGEQRFYDIIMINRHIGLYAIAYCAARNYCLVAGRYDEASVWDQRYNDEIVKLRLRRRSHLPRRSWL